MAYSDNNIIKVYFGYSWANPEDKSQNSGLSNSRLEAFKQLESNVRNSLSEEQKKLVDFRRLRGTAGDYLLRNIYQMIKSSDIMVFDITELNPNVLLELGIAFAIREEVKQNMKIYLIRETKNKRSEKKVPSDLSGYYYTEYRYEGEKIVFSDRNSLKESLVTEIKELTAK